MFQLGFVSASQRRVSPRWNPRPHWAPGRFDGFPSRHGGTPIYGWFGMEKYKKQNIRKMGWFWGVTPWIRMDWKLPPSQASGEAKKAGGPQAYRLTPPCDLGDCSSVMQCSNQWNIVLSVSHFYHLLPFGSQLLQLLNICPCGEGWKVLCLIALRGRGGPHCT